MGRKLLAISRRVKGGHPPFIGEGRTGAKSLFLTINSHGPAIYRSIPFLKCKKQLFELWGYDIMDSKYLQQEFINQAKLAYSVGDYELGLLNEYGQRINIVIKLKRKSTNDYVSFRSGWMVYPNGKIVLTTPYGRK